MATDGERREVASRMRENIGHMDFYTDPLLDALGIEGERGSSNYDLCWKALADLIEPEPERTCHMSEPIDGEYRCSACGHLNRDTYLYVDGWYRPRYCAHCGARVVGNDD